jgi:hypothetical protein
LFPQRRRKFVVRELIRGEQEFRRTVRNNPIKSFFLQRSEATRKLAVRALRDKFKMQVLIDIVKERERGRENKNPSSRRETEEQDHDTLAPIRERFSFAEEFHRSGASWRTTPTPVDLVGQVMPKQNSVSHP